MTERNIFTNIFDVANEELVFMTSSDKAEVSMLFTLLTAWIKKDTAGFTKVVLDFTNGDEKMMGVVAHILDKMANAQLVAIHNFAESADKSPLN